MKKGQKMPDSVKAKISAANKGHKGPDREKCAERTRALWSDPEFRQAQIDAHKKAWQNEDIVARMNAIHQSDEFKAKMSAISKRRVWTQEDKDRFLQNTARGRSLPGARERWLAKNREARQRPENREKSRKRAKALMADPIRRAAVSDGVSMKWDDPQYREAVTSHPNRCRYGRTTAIERKVADFLTDNSIPFEQEKHLIGLRGWVDFYLPKTDVVIECDGTYWHSRPGAAEKDQRRDQYFAAHGLRVLRLPEKDIQSNWGEVTERIMRVAT